MGPRAVPLPPARARGGRRERWGPGKRIRGAHPFRGAGGGLQPRRARALGRAGRWARRRRGRRGCGHRPRGARTGDAGMGAVPRRAGGTRGRVGERSLGGRRAAGTSGGGERRARGSRGGKRGRAPRGKAGAARSSAGPGRCPLHSGAEGEEEEERRKSGNSWGGDAERMLIPEGRAAAALEAERAGRRGAGLRAGIREAAAVRPGCVRYGTAAPDCGRGLRERKGRNGYRRANVFGSILT